MRKTTLVLFILALLAALAAGCTTTAEGEVEVDWLTDWTVALERAQDEDKPLAIYIYTDVCPACRKVEAGAFKDSDLGAFFNSNFVPLKSNAGRSNLYQRYGVTAVPIVIFSSHEGYQKENELARISGAKPAADFIDAGQAVLDQWE